jgi:hypothetical protein
MALAVTFGLTLIVFAANLIATEDYNLGLVLGKLVMAIIAQLLAWIRDKDEGEHRVHQHQCIPAGCVLVRHRVCPQSGDEKVDAAKMSKVIHLIIGTHHVPCTMV